MPENESDIMIRMRVLAGEIFNQRAYADYIMRQMFPATAEGTYLDAHAAQRNLTRKSATKAVGRVTFSTDAEEHGDILIPGGTVVCTVGDMRRFVTNYDVTLSSGEQSANAGVTAAEAGSAYNAGIGTVGIIVTPVLGIDRVANTARFSGGSDAESDAELRARISDSFKNISNGTNAAYYRAVAMSVNGVYSASAVGRVRGTGTVDVYACAKGSTLSYAKLQEIQNLLNEARELNVDVKVFSPTAVSVNLYIKLSVAEGYDFSTVAEEVKNAVTAYINDLGIGHDVLLSDVGEIIYHIGGVSGYKFLESYGSDRTISDDQYTVAKNILVRDE